MNDFRLLIVAQLVVTLALLGFAYVMRTFDATVSSIVVGAVVAHWLRESATLGREATARRRKE